MTSLRRAVLILVLLNFATGCAKFFGGLRRDLDDSGAYSAPTVGGRWSEREYLSEHDEADAPGYGVAVGHAERSLASNQVATMESAGSWLTPDQADQNQRELYRLYAETNASEAMESGSPLAPAPSPSSKRAYKNGVRATSADFRDEASHTGSLWASDGQTNYYFSKNKVRGVGDIVTINVEQEFYKDVLSEVTRTLSQKEKEAELQVAHERIKARVLTASAAAQRAPAAKEETQSAAEKLNVEEVQVRDATVADIDVSSAVEIKVGEPILGEIVERYPNGNYKIRGTKRLRYRNDPRLLSFVGVVRSADISEEDLLNSGRLYEYRLEILQ